MLAQDRSLPEGWYAVATDAELCPGSTRAVRLAGRELVLWRGEGDPVLSDSVCPHLGADLAVVGRVVDGHLRCAFHGFRFDGQGACVATGYGGKVPPRAVLETRPLVFHHGLWFAWVGEGMPSWSLPIVDDTAWTPPMVHTLHLDAHPQDVTENSVDIGHFAWVHGYRNVEVVDPLSLQGPQLRTRYVFSRPLLAGLSTRQDIDLFVLGLGYSRVEAHQVDTGLRLRLFVLPTPEGDGSSDDRAMALRIAVSIPRGRSWAWRLVRPALQRILLSFYAHDVDQDRHFWAHKTPLQRPALAHADGPIGRYQVWARQFYADRTPLRQARAGGGERAGNRSVNAV